jgi:hypothetical protein
VIVTAAGFGTFAGAVNMPADEIVPCAASPPFTLFTCQVTVLFVVFETTTVNCCGFPVCTLTVGGETTTVTGGGGGFVSPPPLEQPTNATPKDNAAARQQVQSEPSVVPRVFTIDLRRIAANELPDHN